jgi:hypothetical protein
VCGDAKPIARPGIGGKSLKRTLLITLLLVTPAAAQDVSMVQRFAEGFTFQSHFAGNRRRNAERIAQCEDRFEATIDERMMTAFETTSGQLKTLCRWK